jgi:hypothetical protein
MHSMLLSLLSIEWIIGKSLIPKNVCGYAGDCLAKHSGIFEAMLI